MSADPSAFKMAASNVSSTESLTKTRNMPEKDEGLKTFSTHLGGIPEGEELEIDLAVKCRGCFVEDPEMHYLFTVFDQKLSLGDILMQTTSFEVKEDDGFPPYLCTKCTTCLIDFFNFKIQYQKTDIYVRTLLEKVSTESIETVTIKDEVDSDDQQANYEHNSEEELEQVEDERFIPDFNNSEYQSRHCNICDLEFINSKVQVTHMAKEHGQNPFIKYKLFKQIVLDNQKTAMLAQKKMKQREEDLREELLFNMPGKLCKFCRKKFPEDEFKEHWEIHKTHVCEQCAYKCVKKADLEVHIQGVHNTERNFSCHLCTRSFKTKALLKRHQVVHLNTRRYCCDVCGQRFNDSGTLKTHVHLKHGGSRDFICPICGMAFPMKPTLDKHIIRHNKNRPPTFYCELCPATFRDKSSMTRHHLVKHTNEYQRPTCEFCGKSYCSNTKLRMHKERHHSGSAYERKKRGPNKIEVKEERYSSETEESSGSYEGESRTGPKVMNVSEDFYKDDHSYGPQHDAKEEEGEYFEYEKQSDDNKGSESSEADSEYE